MGDQYQGEQVDAQTFRGAAHNWSSKASTPNADVKQVRTEYLNPLEQQKHELKVGGDGRLLDAGGKLADSSGALSTGLSELAGDAGKQIFVMNKEGTLRTADAWAGHKEEQIEGGAEGATRMSFLNHSSLAAELPDWVSGDRHADRKLNSGEVAGAGELKMKEGQLQQITDASGHYRPESHLTGQVLDRFETLGVDMHDTELKLTGTPDRPLHASVREFQEERKTKNAPAWQTPEQRMLDRRAAMGKGIAEAHAKREERIETGQPRMRDDIPVRGERPDAKRTDGDAAVLGNDWWKEAFQLDQANEGTRKEFKEKTWLDRGWEGLTTGASTLWDQTSSAVSSVADTVGTGLSSVAGSIGSGIGAAWDWASGGLSNMFGGGKAAPNPAQGGNAFKPGDVFDGYAA
jgi:hypothetical protein